MKHYTIKFDFENTYSKEVIDGFLSAYKEPAENFESEADKIKYALTCLLCEWVEQNTDVITECLSYTVAYDQDADRLW